MRRARQNWELMFALAAENERLAAENERLRARLAELGAEDPTPGGHVGVGAGPANAGTAGKRGRPPEAEVGVRRGQQLAAAGRLPTSVNLGTGDVSTYPLVKRRRRVITRE
jgi:hypothetical protein